METEIFGEQVRKEKMTDEQRLLAMDAKLLYLTWIESDLAHNVWSVCDILGGEILADRVKHLATQAKAEFDNVAAMSGEQFLKYRADMAV